LFYKKELCWYSSPELERQPEELVFAWVHLLSEAVILASFIWRVLLEI